MMLKAKQKGFTLLELLVVITLLAILSVGALVAYDGLTEKAQASATANNTGAVDRAIRQYRVIAAEYPDQWDNLVASGTGLDMLATETKEILSALTAGPQLASAAAALEEIGVEELQETTVALIPNVVPNLQHNEGATSGVSDEVAVASATSLAYLTYDNQATLAGGTGDIEDSNRINKFNDNFETDESHVLIALGFGHDAAHSTADSKVGIMTAPTYTSAKINPAVNYARYIGLFHVAESASAAGLAPTDASMEWHEKAHFVGIIDPEGNGIDDNIAEAISAEN